MAPLETLRKQVERQESVAHITQAEHEVVKAFDAAISKIEEAAKKPGPKPGDEETPKPVVRQRRVVRPAEFTSKTYLETPEDVNAFLEELRRQLEAAIANNERIQIR